MDCKRSSSPESGAIIGGNEDFLMEILLFLPVKSLIRFQSVSKHWRSLILDPRFSHLHSLHHFHHLCHKPQTSFLLCDTTSRASVCLPTVKKLFSFRFRFRYQKILQSCNGLLLLECGNPHSGPKDYFICNPTTRKYRKLLPSEEQMEGFLGLSIVFDPSISPYYKVFSFRTNDLYSEWVEVYDSETHTWKQRVKVPHISTQVIDGVYWNDGIYWIQPRLTSFCFSSKDDCYGFNSKHKVPRVHSRARENHVMESNGHMHYAVLSLHPDKNYVYVYEVNNKDRIWHLKYKASLNPISSEFAGNDGTCLISLLGIVRGERKEDSVLLLHVPGKIMVYSFCMIILRCWLILQQRTTLRRDNCSFCLRMRISSSIVLLLFDAFLPSTRLTLL
ncbi:hypothetical protein CDL12_15905 [Handroanthus impetiginosus]|uniref:F-box domain-containing protein n=1 Tax=Handroanthus impetiginosus TaxID=429701 RepID=A0A2G9H1V8_9LAMI|nr:hypothetical protein CDL12_15905 [Handroanthus impetiginosus]